MSKRLSDGKVPTSGTTVSIRSRLPSVTSTAHCNPHSTLLSPLRRPKNNENDDINYRDRSNERSGDTLQRAEIFRFHVDSNKTPSRPHHNRELEVEQDERGRSREEKSVDVNKAPTHSPGKQKTIIKDLPQLLGDMEDDDEMFSLMGFSGFGTTKGKSVAGTQGGAVGRVVSTDYRQYMNREKGFNRPLSPGRK